MKYPTFGFVREKIIEYSNNEFITPEDSIAYLEWVKAEYQCNPPKLDPNTRDPISLIECIDNQINYQKRCIERDREAIKNDDDDLCRIVGERRSVVRIFEAMKKAKIIETNTQPKSIVSIFFREKEEQRKAAKYYSKKSSDINELGTNTTDTQLEEFIKILIKDSFESKSKILRELREHISSL